MRVADVNSDHRMMLAKEKIKLAKNAKIETKRIRYNMDKLIIRNVHGKHILTRTVEQI